MILVPLLNPKFATVLAEKSCELRVRGTSAVSACLESPRHARRMPGIHVFAAGKTWMAGTSPAMTASMHSRQLPKRIKRSQRDEFEGHQVRLAERQLLEHVVSGSRVRHVQDESNAASVL